MSIIEHLEYQSAYTKCVLHESSAAPEIFENDGSNQSDRAEENRAKESHECSDDSSKASSSDDGAIADYLDEIAESGFPNTQRFGYRVAKRAFDIFFAIAALLVLSPFLLLVAAAIKLSSAGPAFFRQERIGKNGRRFQMLKFRTMRVADKSVTDTAWSTERDPRRTAIGDWLRCTSIDELPQFINVLCGAMSVVGPRPERPYFVEQFSKEIRHYNLRHTGDVGITGLAQVRGYRGDTSIPERVLLDLKYLENWSLLLDLKIIGWTLLGGFHAKTQPTESQGSVQDLSHFSE